MIEEIHKNDIGTKFLVTVMDGAAVVDISSASEKKIIFRKPNKNILTTDGIFETDGTDGKIYYITVSDNLNIVGDWNIQAKITLPSGIWSSSVARFTVYSNLEV